MALYSRPHPDAEALIERLRSGKATKDDMKTAAMLIENEMKRADKNSDDLNYEKMKFQGAMEAVKVMSSAQRRG